MLVIADKEHLLGREAGENCILDLLVHFLRIVPHLITVAANERDDVGKNGVEVPRFEYFLAEALSDVKDGIARGHQHFRVLVDLKTLHDRLEDLVQELGHGLLEKRLVALIQRNS